MKKTILAAIFAVLLSVSGVAFAAPKVEVNTDYYEVRGNTADEIRKDIIKQRRSLLGNDARYDARTEWHVKWNFWWSESDGLCSITKVQTNLDVRYILPKHRGEKRLPAKVKRKWMKYIRALVRHEKEHARSGLLAAKSIEKQIGNMSPHRTCARLEKDANSIGDAILEKARVRDIQYDKDTNHGMKEGAKFP